ncbi:MAG: hypothetical protein IPH95_03955 [Candidatus Promineofilum sp.]|jgi:hypothetical protein|nr:hypothetical protein [Promineifilum sp.]
MQTTLRFFVLLLALLALAACGVAPESEPDTCDGPDFLFADDFSGEFDCGWALYDRGGGAAAIDNAAMQLAVGQPGQLWWTNPGRDFDDVVITTEARQVDGPNDNAYGVICRYQNEENFYAFMVSGDGYYAIGKYQSGVETVTYLTPDAQFQPSDAINVGVASNELRVSCVGNQLSMEVNGIPLLSVTDPTFVTGDIGLAAATLQQGTAIVEFDNVRVTTP